VQRSVKIVPAILTDDPERLADMVRQAEAFADYAQFDIMDGEFVPSRSVTHEDLAGIHTGLTWEAHLMTMRPEDHLEGFRRAGAKRAIFHYEATTSPLEVIDVARNLGLEVGLAVNPETPVSAIAPLLGAIDIVLLLSVHPGYYGRGFIQDVLSKIPEVRAMRQSLEIGLDGGVKESNIGQIARSGVDFVCVGSAIFLQPNPAEGYARLVALAQKSSLHHRQV
jgi:ribulose-phosphate 3-epimerase